MTKIRWRLRSNLLRRLNQMNLFTPYIPFFFSSYYGYWKHYFRGKLDSWLILISNSFWFDKEYRWLFYCIYNVFIKLSTECSTHLILFKWFVIYWSLCRMSKIFAMLDKDWSLLEPFTTLMTRPNYGWFSMYIKCWGNNHIQK